MKSIRRVTKKPIAGVRRLIRGHRLSVFGLATIIALWGVSNVLAWNYFEQQQNAQEASSKELLADLDKTIERVKAEKEAQRIEEEQKAKEAAEAEAQKKADEEAQEAAQSQQTASGNSAGCNLASAHIDPNSIDILVNKKHCLVPLSFAPADLVTTHGATISSKAASDFNRMFADAAAAGQPLTVSSSYRSYSNQVSTYNYWVSVNGQAAADTVSARPGFSEHQTGLAVDIGANGCSLNCFGGTTQYQWLQANAANYGFIQRYYSGYEAATGYSSEEWHYRYIGTATAQDMKAKGIKTLEQYWGMEGGGYR